MKQMWSKEELEKLPKNIDTLVDSAGNPRFVEGNGTPATIEGFTSTYCKWSLSGTHLMIVLTGTLDKEIIIGNYTFVEFANYEIPEWILNKIKTFIYPSAGYSIASINSLIDFNTSSNSIDKKDMFLVKKENYIYIGFRTQYTAGANSHNFRIQFDLIIDTE